MKRPYVVIWGAGAHAEVVADIVELSGDYMIAGFLDDVRPERKGEAFLGYNLLGGVEELPALRRRGVQRILIGFGHNRLRLRCAALALEEGFELASAVHPAAVVARSSIIGAGTVIKAGAMIDPDVQIGRLAAISSGVTIGHGSRLGETVRLSSGAVLAGAAVIGDAAWLGSGAIVINGVNIGEGSILGAGALATRDVPAGCVAVGVPAHVARQAADEDFY